MPIIQNYTLKKNVVNKFLPLVMALLQGIKKLFNSRLPDSPSRGVDFRLRISPRNWAGGEVFLTPGEMLQAESREKDEEKQRQMIAKERRKLEMELEEARKREDARLAGELGRELGRKAVKAKGSPCSSSTPRIK